MVVVDAGIDGHDLDLVVWLIVIAVRDVVEVHYNIFVVVDVLHVVLAGVAAQSGAVVGHAGFYLLFDALILFLVAGFELYGNMVVV